MRISGSSPPCSHRNHWFVLGFSRMVMKRGLSAPEDCSSSRAYCTGPPEDCEESSLIQL